MVEWCHNKLIILIKGNLREVIYHFYFFWIFLVPGKFSKNVGEVGTENEVTPVEGNVAAENQVQEIQQNDNVVIDNTVVQNETAMDI